MKNLAIEVLDISKRYRIGSKIISYNTLTAKLISVITRPIENFKRLKMLTNFQDGDNKNDVLWALKNMF